MVVVSVIGTGGPELSPGKHTIVFDFKYDGPGYCVGTVGLDSEMIRKYVKYQGSQVRKGEKHRKLF
jgi:hypothetical protein